MLLYTDELVELEYLIAQNILHVKPQDQREHQSSEFKRITVSIVVCARENKVEKLLVDFSRNRLVMTVQEYKSLLVQLVIGLMHSPVQKIARIATEDMEREQLFKSMCDQIRAAIKLPVEIRSFRDRAEALQWLDT